MATPPILLPLWPRAPLRETLEWLTYVMVSEDGTEERTELRTSPRQTLSMSYFVPPLLQARINNIVYGSRTLQWWVPVWPQVQNVGTVPAGQTFLTAETRYSEFRDGGMVMLWESPESYQLLEMDAVTSNTNIDLNEPTEAFTNAWLMPLRRGYLPRHPERNLSGHNSVLEMTYVIEDNEELSPDAPAQYLGSDIYYDNGLLEGGRLTEEIAAAFDLFDQSLGLVSYRAPWLYNRPVRPYRLLVDGVADAWELREWLHRRAGRYRPFWLPSFENDLRVTSTGAITTTLSVKADDYIGYAEDRSHIAVETSSGWLPRALSNPTPVDPETIQLTLSSSLGVNASDIKRVCFLGLKRLDGDRVELNWIGGTVCEMAVTTLEIAP